MGKRRGGGGVKEKKRKKVTVRLLKREHAGEVTEPYRIMEELIAKTHTHLADASIVIAWRKGWRPDADNHVRLGQCRKRGDLDRELDKFDFVILINEEYWAGLNDDHKRALIDHELCHAQIVYDSDGEPKRDDRNRLVCRIRKHDVEEFRDVVQRHGLYTADLAEIAKAAINDAQRPLLKAAEAKEADGNGKAESNGQAKKKPKDIDAGVGLLGDVWAKNCAVIGLSEKQCDALEQAGINTLKELQDQMNKHGQFWAKNNGVNGRMRVPIEDAFNDYITRFAAAKGK